MQIWSDRKFKFGGKWWVLDHATETELRFKVGTLGKGKDKGFAGNFLRRWRRQKRNKKMKPVTQTQAGEIFGVSQSTIARIENGERSMSYTMFKQINKDFIKHGKNAIPHE
jgi:DNA-binding XRE family transcriptional regulator